MPPARGGAKSHDARGQPSGVCDYSEASHATTRHDGDRHRVRSHTPRFLHCVGSAMTPEERVRFQQLIGEWRMSAIVEGQAAIEGAATREKELLEHSADTFSICADELDALLTVEEPAPGPQPPKKCALCDSMQPCPSHGLTPITDADFDEVGRFVAHQLSETNGDTRKEAPTAHWLLQEFDRFDAILKDTKVYGSAQGLRECANRMRTHVESLNRASVIAPASLAGHHWFEPGSSDPSICEICGDHPPRCTSASSLVAPPGAAS